MRQAYQFFETDKIYKFWLAVKDLLNRPKIWPVSE